MYLVTGGAGFIGSNIVAGLASRGEPVTVSDRMGSDERWRNLVRHDVADIIVPQDLKAWLSGRVLKGVIHMGAISATTETDVDLIVENNIRLTLDLWDWCAAQKVPFIYASSAATYGDGALGFDDDGAPDALKKLMPLNAYGWSKSLLDRRIAAISAAKGAMPPQWAGLKFFNVYGPNEYHKAGMKSVVAQNFERVRDGQPIRLFRSHHPDYADGGQLRDFIYVKDCVAVVLWLLDNPRVSGLFNLGTGQARSWLDLAHAMFAALKLTPQIEFIAMPEAIQPRYQYFTQARMERLRQAGFRPPFSSLEEGVADYVQHHLAMLDPYR